MRVDFSKPKSFDASRRKFLESAAATAGAFVLGTYVRFPAAALAQELAPAQGIFDPNVFLKVGTDGWVTILSKHFEMGQGVTTGLATLVAEELEADWSKVRFEFAPNNPNLYNNLLFGPVMATGGTTSMANSWDQMRRVGAAARVMFVEAAASRWSVPAREIKVEKSVVSHASGRRATFGELAADAMRMPVPAEVTLKSASEWKLIGKRIPRLDSLGKTTGRSIFATDIRRPGMLTAVLKRPDVFGAKVASFDDTAARRVEGVVDVVQISRGVAVLATDTWSAIRGRELLEVNWDVDEAEKRSTGEILDEYRTLASDPELVALSRGDSAAGLARAARKVEAEFTFPYLAHAPMEPLNCVIELRNDAAEIWSGCQLQSIDQFVAAQILGLTPERIKINTLLGGGSFGRRGNPLADWTVELCEVAKAIRGRAPVHLMWTREDDIRGGFYRPLALHRVEAGLDARGRITGWHHRLVTQPIFIGTPFEQMAVKNGIDSSSVEGIVDTPYALGDLKVEVHNAKSPLPVLWWRSVGHSHTAHVMETMIDELARLAQKDPVAFRLELLAEHSRDSAVVRLAAEKAGWRGAMPSGRGRGFAYHRSFQTRVAMVAEVSITPRTAKVDRIVAAVDCGVAINPDIVIAQIEGAVGYGLSAVLRNQVTLRKGLTEQSNFDDYEPTRMREMPEVEVHIVDSRERPSGIGEPGVPPLAPAIGNAIFAATGERLRSLPFGLKTPT